jgi:hypothetical protein
MFANPKAVLALAVVPILLLAGASLSLPTVAEDGSRSLRIPPPRFRRLKLKNSKNTPASFTVRGWKSGDQGQELSSLPMFQFTVTLQPDGQPGATFEIDFEDMGLAILRAEADGKEITASAPPLYDTAGLPRSGALQWLKPSVKDWYRVAKVNHRS